MRPIDGPGTGAMMCCDLKETLRAGDRFRPSGDTKETYDATALARRGYFLGIVAGLITSLGATVAGKLLIHLGLHADLTYLDDVLLGALVALLVLVLHRDYDRQRGLDQERIANMIAVHRSIAADLLTIATITGNVALAEIANDAAAKIQATIAALPTAQELLGQEKPLAARKSKRNSQRRVA